jgi:protein-tyrosine sulfotransferase
MSDEILKKWQNKDWNDIDNFSNSTFVSNKKIIVIGACARSGTTLLRVMLDSHPAIFCGPHTNLFVPTKINLNDLSNQLDIDLKELEILYSKHNDRVNFIHELIPLILRQHKKTIFGEKTARNIHSFGWIQEHFPNARFIHVIRNGKDVICSLRTHRKRKVVDNKIVPLHTNMPINACIDRWQRSVSDGIQFRGNNNYIEIKYEDLVLNTEQTLLRICKFIEIDFNDAMLEYYKINGSTRDPLKFPQNIEATKPIYLNSINRWERDLTEDEVALFLERCYDLQILLGYN